MILVIGASGILGNFTTEILQSYNFPLRLASRSIQKLENLRAGNTEIVQADLTDKNSLEKALQGVETVIACAHSLMGKGKYDSDKVDLQGHKDLIDLAKRNGVKHFIYISVHPIANKHVEFWNTKAEIENYLQQSGLKYTIIRASAFMEMHIHKLMGESILQKNKATIFGEGNLQLNTVSAKDIAKVILLLVQQKMDAELIEIGGPDNLSRKEIVNLYGEILNRQPKVKHISRGQLRFLSKVIKPFHSGLSRIMKTSAALDELDLGFDNSKIQAALPFAMKSVKEFIAEKLQESKAS